MSSLSRNVESFWYYEVCANMRLRNTNRFCSLFASLFVCSLAWLQSDIDCSCVYLGYCRIADGTLFCFHFDDLPHGYSPTRTHSHLAPHFFPLDAPTKGFEAFVGRRCTFRANNLRWTQILLHRGVPMDGSLVQRASSKEKVYKPGAKTLLLFGSTPVSLYSEVRKGATALIPTCTRAGEGLTRPRTHACPHGASACRCGRSTRRTSCTTCRPR